ncbi:Gfo/Idh/MocA family protein [Paenibacillus sp. FSL R7-0128]|uniref:Gfo/Idh/MocA family protein n=1 Tax=Paenibacillus sp. FSL R7-0128 TaxID=2954529 RepID=UPI0030F80E7B
MAQRILLVGHGSISRTYIEALDRLPEVVIAGVVGRSEERAAAFAKLHGIEVYGTSITEMAHRSAATAAVICTPNAAHYDHVLESAAAGLHCLCEKPLHIHPEQQKQMIEACRSQGVVLTVSYMRRYTEHWQLIKQIMDSGEMGRILSVDASIKHYRSSEYYHSWHGTYSEDGGGPFMQQGAHLIDLIQWLCGGYTEVLDAKTFRLLHSIETEDHGYAIVKYANGAIGMIQASTACTGMAREKIEISGTAGSISADFAGILDCSLPGRAVNTTAQANNPELFARLCSDFLNACKTGANPLINADSAAITTRLILDIYKAAGIPVQTF